MIKGFADAETEKVWNGEGSKKLPPSIQHVARRKLRMLNAAQELQDLQVPPSNRLESLKGKAKDYWSIRVNKQWRVEFKWKDGHDDEVGIMDYHK